MTFAIITHVAHIIKEDKYYGYAPYVKEMNLWAKYVDKMIIVAPVSSKKVSSIEIAYESDVDFLEIQAISLKSFVAFIKAIAYLPGIFYSVYSAMKKCDHIHLRCPGNIGLIGCLTQILFPKKPKTAKYAGNWDPNANQPRSYRIQKWLLSNTFLTRNMQVLVYGDWPEQSKNIKPFFTASYSRSMITDVRKIEFEQPLRFMFVGSLSPGKRPMYAVELVSNLHKLGHEIYLDMYGEGEERDQLESYIQTKKVSHFITLHGNQTSKHVEEAYKKSDFLILASKSEGWPKVVAEAMFWGVLPIVTNISCVAWMIGFGERGVIVNGDIETDVEKITDLLQNINQLKDMSANAQKWSNQYTMDDFKDEIKKLIG